MNWFKRCLAQAAVTVNLEAYEASLRQLVTELVDKEYANSQRFNKFNIDIPAVQAALAEAGFPNPAVAVHALQTGDVNEVSNVNMQLYTMLREQGSVPFGADPQTRNEWNDRYMAVRKAWGLLRDCERHLTSGNKPQYDANMAEQQTQQVVAQTAKNMEAVKNVVEAAIARSDWQGSPVALVARTVDKNDEYLEPISGAEIVVGSAANSPSFTYYDDGGKPEIDDVIEGGDEDFNAGPAVTADYFTLINEIRKPGSTSRKGRTLTLYTARPAKDRRQYENASTLPPNLFLTTSFSSAEGIAHDLGGGEARDVWRARIDSRYLIETLNTGKERQYQIVGAKPVPVQKMELYAPGN